MSNWEKIKLVDDFSGEGVDDVAADNTGSSPTSNGDIDDTKNIKIIEDVSNIENTENTSNIGSIDNIDGRNLIRGSTLSVRTQCALLQLNRSTYYYQKIRQNEVLDYDQQLMRAIDKIYTKCPYYGSRKMAKQLSRDLKIAINRKRVQRLMRLMGIEAVYPKPRTSTPAPGHKVYPYLLSNIKANYPNHIWGVDITYIPLHQGWLYLVALLDWYSRYVISWELSDSLGVGFCSEALDKALETSKPDYHNSDQGSQFTANDYIDLLKGQETIKISMDGRGAYFDNIFTERLWRSVKREEVYIHDYQSPREARNSIGKYFDIYNNYRLHESLNYQTPREIYFGEKKIVI